MVHLAPLARSVASCNLRRVPQSSAALARSFSSTSLRERDFVQELYLREIKSYQPPPQPKDAHVGQVKEFHSPPAPQAPAVPSAQEISSELESWNKDPISETKPTTQAASSGEEQHAQSADEYLAFLESRPADGEGEEAHH